MPHKNKTKKMFGIVTDCLKMNIYNDPNENSEAITNVNCLDQVMVDPDSSTDEWYAVCTSFGIEGFCMKKFVAICQ